jgi:hypothetical protein
MTMTDLTLRFALSLLHKIGDRTRTRTRQPRRNVR